MNQGGNYEILIKKKKNPTKDNEETRKDFRNGGVKITQENTVLLLQGEQFIIK